MLVKDLNGKWYEVSDETLKKKAVEDEKAIEAIAVERAGKRKKLVDYVSALDPDEAAMLRDMLERGQRGQRGQRAQAAAGPSMGYRPGPGDRLPPLDCIPEPPYYTHHFPDCFDCVHFPDCFDCVHFPDCFDCTHFPDCFDCTHFPDCWDCMHYPHHFPDCIPDWFNRFGGEYQMGGAQRYGGAAAQGMRRQSYRGGAQQAMRRPGMRPRTR